MSPTPRGWASRRRVTFVATEIEIMPDLNGRIPDRRVKHEQTSETRVEEDRRD